MADRTLIIPDGFGLMRITTCNHNGQVLYADLIPYKRGPWFSRNDRFQWNTHSYESGYQEVFTTTFEVLT